MSEASGLPSSKPKPWGQAAATFFTCLVLGPPIGGWVFALTTVFLPGLPAVPADAATGWAGHAGVALFVGLFAIPFSYLVGGLQAAATGLAFSAYGWFRGKPPLWFAGLTAAVVFAASAAGGLASNTGIVLPMVLVHAIPTWLCWLIVRTYWWRAVP